MVSSGFSPDDNFIMYIPAIIITVFDCCDFWNTLCYMLSLHNNVTSMLK